MSLPEGTLEQVAPPALPTPEPNGHTLKVLDVGCGDKKVCRQNFPDADITTLDLNEQAAPDVVADFTQPLPTELVGQFDCVWMSHVLEHVDRLKVIETVRHVAEALRPGGDLFVIVPALEWAAEEILKVRPSSALISFLYGSQENEWQYHRSGFTLLALRQVCQLAGLHPMQASQGKFKIDMDRSGQIIAVQNIVVARKPI